MKSFILSFIVLGAVFIGPSIAHASISTISLPINLIACTPDANPPSANAGPDQTIYLPTTSTTISATGSGCPNWYVIYYPGTTPPTIVSSASATTSVTGLTTVGAYGFGVTYKNSANQPASDLVQVTIANPGADLTAGNITPTTATRTLNTTVQAVITNQGSTSTGSSAFNNLFQFDSDTDHNVGLIMQSASMNALGAGASATATTSYIFPTAGTWYARACADYDTDFNGTVTESVEWNNCGAWTTITVAPTSADNGSCAATHYSCISGSSSSNNSGVTQWTWICSGSNGGTDSPQCVENKPVVTNGSCGASHYSCTAGDSDLNYDGPTQWTWICAGRNGGTDSGQCTETKTAGAACGDSLDNDGDGKVDLADPGCSQGSDNSEDDPKPVFIEF